MSLCVSVCVGRGEGERVYVQNAPRVSIHNVPVCTDTTRTCVSTCARGAGTHGDVLNRDTEFPACHTTPNTHTLHDHNRNHRPHHRQRKREKRRRKRREKKEKTRGEREERERGERDERDERESETRERREEKMKRDRDETR